MASSDEIVGAIDAQGRIYGRGSRDVRSGIAASRFAVDALEAASVGDHPLHTDDLRTDPVTFHRWNLVHE